MMIEYYKIGNYEFPYNLELEKVGIKISGGADSTLIAYILAKLKSEGLINSTFYTMTNEHHDRPYQIDVTNRVLNWITERTGVSFDYRISVFSPTTEAYSYNSSNLVSSSKDRYSFSWHYMGITANPPVETGIVQEDPNRTHDRNKSVVSNYKFTPWINYDKQDIAAIYNELDVMELFSLTRSCEAKTFDFSEHCGKCWWCVERHWGFGKYE